jgi:O-acetyl-ADP-ribose deacetylase (regulator of RNase III)
MANELRVNDKTIRLLVGFITDLPGMDGIVYYASPDLVLGSGYGTAISVQGGPKVQEELKKMGGAALTEVVATGGGNLQAKHILHAVGPRFQEEGTEEKLKTTMLNALKSAFPAMGTGFYGIPLDVSARLTLGVAREFLQKAVDPKEIVFCLRDNRELKAFQEQLQKM